MKDLPKKRKEREREMSIVMSMSYPTAKVRGTFFSYGMYFTLSHRLPIHVAKTNAQLL